jgi:hypothetical protein
MSQIAMTTDVSAVLRAGGLAHPLQLVRTIKETISRLELDLSGLVVLTEAASGAYVVTSAIAAVAGAKQVIALTRDSRYGTATTVTAQTRALAALCGVAGRIDIHTVRSADLFGRADLVTNLGFVRPLDRQTIGQMKRGAVIAYMCESWEFRPEDLDIEACREHGVSVLGTNESLPEFDIFSSCGWLCLRLLGDAQIAPARSTIVVVSSDKFGVVIQRALERAGAAVHLVATLRPGAHVAAAEGIVIADYLRTDPIIGSPGDISAAELASLAPASTVIQFAGRVDVQGLRDHGLVVIPGIDLPPRRMATTLAGLGPRLVIELHAAGLKVGEIGLRPEAPGKWSALCQPLTSASCA